MTDKIIIQEGTNVEVIKNRIYEVRGQRVMLDRDLAELYNVETKVLNQAVKRNIERFPKDFMFQLDRKDVLFLRSQQTTVKEYNADLRSQFVTLNKNNDDMSSQIVMTNRLGHDVHNSLRCPNGTLKSGRGQHAKYMPHAFTEEGVAMLSGILRSPMAIQVNINIMRAFVMIRQAVAAWQDTNLKVEQLSHKVDSLNARVDEILHEQCRRLRTPLNKNMKVSNENNMEMAIQIGALNDALDQLREKPSTPRKRIGFKQSKK